MPVGEVGICNSPMQLLNKFSHLAAVLRIRIRIWIRLFVGPRIRIRIR
jgi:hypothetical protein